MRYALSMLSARWCISPFYAHPLRSRTRKHGAERYVLFNTPKSALDHKILHFANRLGFWPKALLPSSTNAEFLHDGDYKFTVPSAFKLLKWKTAQALATVDLP